MHRAVEQTGGVAGSAAGGPVGLLQHCHPQALPRQRLRHGGTGQAGAHHHGRVGLHGQLGHAAWHEGGRPERMCGGAVAGLDWGCLQPEAGGAQAGVQRGGRVVCDQRGSGCGQAGQGLDRLRECVCAGRIGGVRPWPQTDGVGGQAQRPQRRVQVTERQRQLHPALLEVQQVQVAGGRWPGLLQLHSQIRHRRVGLRACQVSGRQWLRFDRHDMQVRAAGRVLPPGAPQRQEEIGRAVARDQHHEVRSAGPALGQAVALQEHPPGAGRRGHGARLGLRAWPARPAVRVARPEGRGRPARPGSWTARRRATAARARGCPAPGPAAAPARGW